MNLCVCGTLMNEEAPGDSDDKESACIAGDPGSILGSGRSLEGGNGNPLQYSCLKNTMDRGAMDRAAIYGVTQSWTRLKRLSSRKLPCSFHHIRTQQEVCNGEEGPHPTMRDLELGLLASKTLRNKFILFIIYLVCGILHPECKEINC